MKISHEWARARRRYSPSRSLLCLEVSRTSKRGRSTSSSSSSSSPSRVGTLKGASITVRVKRNHASPVDPTTRNGSPLPPPQRMSSYLPRGSRPEPARHGHTMSSRRLKSIIFLATACTLSVLGAHSFAFAASYHGLSWFRQSPCRAWATGFDSIAQLAFEASHVSAKVKEKKEGRRISHGGGATVGWMTQIGIFW